MKALALQIAAAVVTLTIAVPLSLFPLRWARFIGWAIPDDVRLVNYFARCLGVVVGVMCGLAVYASLHPPLVDPPLATVSATMLIVAVVHTWSARWSSWAQPLFETIEIAIYFAGGCFFAWLAIS